MSFMRFSEVLLSLGVPSGTCKYTEFTVLTIKRGGDRFQWFVTTTVQAITHLRRDKEGSYALRLGEGCNTALLRNEEENAKVVLAEVSSNCPSLFYGKRNK
jgi:hypothetical protein